MALCALCKSNAVSQIRSFPARGRSRAGSLFKRAPSAPPPFSFPFVGNVLGANDRIGVGCIGVHGKGASDVDDAARSGGEIVALCDVDETFLKEKAQKYPQARLYRDYRKMLEEMGKTIDAVTVSTPDHDHAVATMRAMQMGKHVFCQKPLTQTILEARQVRALAAKKKKLATQMGNQGSAAAGLRRAVEVVQSGCLGRCGSFTCGPTGQSGRRA